MTITHSAARYLTDLFQPEAVEARDRMRFAILRSLVRDPGRSVDRYGPQSPSQHAYARAPERR